MDQRGSTHFEDKDNDMIKHTRDFLDTILELEQQYKAIPRNYAEEKTRIVRNLNIVYEASPEERQRLLEEQKKLLNKEIEEIKRRVGLSKKEKNSKCREIERRLQEITDEINELPNKTEKEFDKYVDNVVYDLIEVAIETDEHLIQQKIKDDVSRYVAHLNRLYTVKGYKQEMIYESLKEMAEFGLYDQKLDAIFRNTFNEALMKYPALENVYISYSEKNVELSFDVEKRVINVDALGDSWEFTDATLNENNVTIKGDVEAVKRVAKVEAWVDLSKLTNPQEGANSLDEVELVALDADGNMLNVNIEPKTISANVMLKALQKGDIEKPVQLELLNEDVIGDDNKLNVTLNPNSVKVKGDLASTVASVKATVDVSQIGDPTVGEHTLNGINLVAYDADGNPVDVDLEPPVVDATLSISKKIEPPTDIEKNPKKTWQTWLALAAGIGVGAAVAFGVGPIGVSVMAIAGGLANKFVNKKRQELRLQRLQGKLPVEEVIESKGIKGKFEQLKRYMKSERGLRDLSWFLNGAIYSGIGFNLAQSIYGLVASKLPNLGDPDPNLGDPDPNPSDPDPNIEEPYGPQPNPTDDIVLGEQVGNRDLTYGYDSAADSVFGTNAETLMPEYVNENSIFNRFAIVNSDGTTGPIIESSGLSLTDFCNQYGVDPSQVSIDVGRAVDGASQTWKSAAELLSKTSGGMTK